MKKIFTQKIRLLFLLVLSCTIHVHTQDLNDRLWEAKLKREKKTDIGTNNPQSISSPQKSSRTRRRKPETPEEKIVEKLLIFMETKFVPFAEQTAKIVSGKKAQDEITAAKKQRDDAQKAFENRRNYGRSSYSPSRYSSGSSRDRSPYPSSGYGRPGTSRWGDSSSPQSRWGRDYDYDDDYNHAETETPSKEKDTSKRSGGYGAAKEKDEKDTTAASNRALNLQNTIIADLNKIREDYDNFNGTDDEFSESILRESRLSKLAQNIDQYESAAGELHLDEAKDETKNAHEATTTRGIQTPPSKQAIQHKQAVPKKQAVKLTGYKEAFEKAIPALVRAATYVPLDPKNPIAIRDDEYAAISEQQKATKSILNQPNMREYTTRVKAEIDAVAHEQHKKFAPLVDPKIKTIPQTPTKAFSDQETKACEFLGKAAGTLALFANNFQSIAAGHQTTLTTLIKTIEEELREKCGSQPEQQKAPTPQDLVLDLQKQITEATETLKALTEEYEKKSGAKKIPDFINVVLSNTDKKNTLSGLAKNFEQLQIQKDALDKLKPEELTKLKASKAFDELKKSEEKLHEVYKKAIPALVQLAIMPFGAKNKKEAKLMNNNQEFVQNILTDTGIKPEYPEDKDPIKTEITRIVDEQLAEAQTTYAAIKADLETRKDTAKASKAWYYTPPPVKITAQNKRDLTKITVELDALFKKLEAVSSDAKASVSKLMDDIEDLVLENS